ncbi:MAG: GHKL domain-containing protein [Clostridiales bacterium]|nr:GHKL domain-containing protein [Clostridiales bacterium]
MKRKTAWLAAAAALTLLFTALSLALRFAQPAQEKVTYDLSLGWAGEAMPSDWVYDQKGWQVFVQEGDAHAALTADGFGGFTGDVHPGQTFYFSRVLDGELDSDPILQLNAFGENVAVFLDGMLIYTDCPEQDNRIGCLALPTREQQRTAPLTINLPGDCAGKTLTIAQSTGLDWEMPTVWPVSVSLTCLSAYVNGLIAEGLRTAVPAALLFIGSAAMLILFLGQLRQGVRDAGLLCAALCLLLWMAVILLQSSFTDMVLRQTRVDWLTLCKGLSLAALLAFLASRAGRLRSILWVLTALTGLTCLLCPIIDLCYEVLTSDWLVNLRTSVPQMTGFLSLCAALICAWCCWRRKQRFYAFFAPISAFLVGALLLGAAVLNGKQLLTQLEMMVRFLTPAYFLWPLTLYMTAAAVVSLAAELIEREIHRRESERLIDVRRELTMQHYESLRTQNEQVMMLLHDMNKHYSVLRQMSGEENVQRYLDELLLQNANIRPVVQSGNAMLDVIVNGKLTQAINAGVRVELVRTDAPEVLPLSDTELCSLMMNMMDNAVSGVLDSGAQQPFIRLDMHLRNGFFVFVLENSASIPEKAKDPAPGHGLGLKIIRQIVERYNGLLETEQGEESFRIKLALPMGERKALEP